MFKLAVSTLAVAVALCLVGSVALAEEVKCEGTITKIEGSNVTVKAADAQHEMTLAPATKITLDGKPARASDLKVGFKVKCTCDKEGEKVTCRQLDATSAAN
jgi:hypothetical protein